MGRTMTPAYRVEYEVSTGRMTPAAWRTKPFGQIPADGKPTQANLDRHMNALIHSLEKGANRHVVEQFGRGSIPYFARLIRQRDNTVMAIWYDYSYAINTGADGDRRGHQYFIGGAR